MIRVLRETHDPSAAVAQRLALAGGRNVFGEPNFRAVWGWNRLGWIGGRWTDRDASGSVLRETIGLRLAPKYFPHNRWHIERWCAPETYGSPEIWARQTMEIEDGRNIAALGPYPSRGEYEHVFTLEYFPRIAPACPEFRRRASAPAQLHSQAAPMDGASSRVSSSHADDGLGAFVQLTPAIAERLALMIERSRAHSGACTVGLMPGAVGFANTPESRRGREALYRREAQRDRAYDAWAEALLNG
ncbi:MAG TPA: hypothetical protein VKR82_08895 [Candidatus Acidoferrales bacterium]|nr:hypothetical protein [Candidatus Acidoferrales bacterium]